MAQEIRRDGDCISLKMLAVTGNDLIAAGIKPGREIGLRLEEMLEIISDELMPEIPLPKRS